MDLVGVLVATAARADQAVHPVATKVLEGHTEVAVPAQLRIVVVEYLAVVAQSVLSGPVIPGLSHQQTSVLNFQEQT